MRVLGMISGTSHDGIDVAVVDFAMEGGTLAGRIEHFGSVPYDPQLRSRIIAALPPAPARLRGRLRAGHQHRAGVRGGCRRRARRARRPDPART